MAQYIWHELAASGLFIYIQRKLGVEENSAIWQKLKQSTAGVGRCWHPKRLSQGAVTLSFLSWGTKAERAGHQAVHSTSASAQRRKDRAHEQSRDTEPFRLLSVLHWKSDECWQGEENSFWWVPDGTATRSTAGGSSSDNHIRLPAQTCGEFILSQTSSVFTCSPKQSYWKKKMLNELYSRRLQNIICVIKSQGRENRQD